MGNPGESDKIYFNTSGDSDMALLTVGNSDIEFCNKSGHVPWGMWKIWTSIHNAYVGILI